jgi:predicted cupin superfamily sugar epimerase
VSCTVGPGFDFLDFEMAKKRNLLVEFPEFQEIIEEMTLD